MNESNPRPHRRDPMASLFRDAVLVLGGAFAVQGTDDATVWRVANGLERVWRRARGLPMRNDARPAPVPHPGIVALLDLIDHEGAAS